VASYIETRFYFGRLLHVFNANAHNEVNIIIVQDSTGSRRGADDARADINGSYQQIDPS